MNTGHVQSDNQAHQSSFELKLTDRPVSLIMVDVSDQQVFQCVDEGRDDKVYQYGVWIYHYYMYIHIV